MKLSADAHPFGIAARRVDQGETRHPAFALHPPPLDLRPGDLHARDEETAGPSEHERTLETTGRGHGLFDSVGTSEFRTVAIRGTNCRKKPHPQVEARLGFET